MDFKDKLIRKGYTPRPAKCDIWSYLFWYVINTSGMFTMESEDVFVVGETEVRYECYWEPNHAATIPKQFITLVE